MEYQDVWSSTDGVSWTLETADPGWCKRHSAGVAEHDGKLWLAGGTDKNLDYSDVWVSSDGAHWSLDGNAPWPGRCAHAAAAFDNKIWVMGGRYQSTHHMNDVWYLE
jgi:hypothetical protein